LDAADALPARGHARRAQRRLHPHRPRQGAGRGDGPGPPRHAQRADPVHDRPGRPDGIPAGRDRHHGVRLRPAGHGQAGAERDPEPRLPGGDGHHPVDRRVVRPAEPGRRPPLPRPRSARPARAVDGPGVRAQVRSAEQGVAPRPGLDRGGRAAPRAAPGRRARRAVRWAIRRWSLTLGLGVVLVLCVAALAAGTVSPYAPDRQNMAATLQPPSRLHPFGTDEFGRDTLSRVVFGARLTLLASSAAVLLAAMRRERGLEYVVAAHAVGASTPYIIVRTLLPNLIGPLAVLGSLGFAYAVLYEASLSFLGLGAQPPTPEWGVMLSSARDYLFQSPWYAFFPGAAIVVLVFSLNLVGDGLRDLLDPYRHNR